MEYVLCLFWTKKSSYFCGSLALDLVTVSGGVFCQMNILHFPKKIKEHWTLETSEIIILKCQMLFFRLIFITMLFLNLILFWRERWRQGCIPNHVHPSVTERWFIIVDMIGHTGSLVIASLRFFGTKILPKVR